jgi:radical SAM protein with 4Fe4S-binding SPASM domain
MDVFDYAGHFIQQLVQRHDPARPLQIELHPGLHCDRYQCPHCFGHGQRPLAGRVLTAAEIANALDEVAECDPLIIVSGVTTEPLTHPEAASVIHAVRARNLRLGLYTKGLRFDAACAEAFFQGEAECFLTFSLDAFNAADYQALHAVRPGGAGRGEGTPGEAYFERVFANIRAACEAKRRTGHHAQLRIAVLLFREHVNDALEANLEGLTAMADLVRVAVAQDRNDGGRVPNLPGEREALLADLAARFRGHPKIRVLTETATPVRATGFTRCHTQRFQVTIDKSGNFYPCPQVAVAPYGHLAYGNLRAGTLRELLRSPARRRLFDQDVTREMRCRVCDRKDEALNRALGRFDPQPMPAPANTDIPTVERIPVPLRAASDFGRAELPVVPAANDAAAPDQLAQG